MGFGAAFRSISEADFKCECMSGGKGDVQKTPIKTGM